MIWQLVSDLTNEIVKQRAADNFLDIVVDFDPTGQVLDTLFQERILTADMYKRLYKETPRENRGRVLLVHLRQGAPSNIVQLLCWKVSQRKDIWRI